MSTIRVMSWNIRNFGESTTKSVDNAFTLPIGTTIYAIDFIVTTVLSKNIDVILIMEVVGSQAKILQYLLLQNLGTGWGGTYTSPQHNEYRKECSLFFWRKSAADVAPVSENFRAPMYLYSTVDDMRMRPFFKWVGWETERGKQMELYATLERSGYLTDYTDCVEKTTVKKATKKRKRNDDDEGWVPLKKSRGNNYESDGAEALYKTANSRTSRDTTVPVPTKVIHPRGNSFSYFVHPDAWNQLKAANAALHLIGLSGQATDLGLTADQLNTLKNILLETDIVLFPHSTDRTPLFIHLVLKGASEPIPLLLVLLHAPNPSASEKVSGVVYKDKFSAISSFELCPPLVNSENALIMGDFNVTTAEMRRKQVNVLKYDRKVLDGHWGFFADERVRSDSPFDPLVAVGATLKMGNDNNNLRTSLADSITMLSKRTIEPNFDYLKEPYDKFFFKGSPTTLTAQNGSLLDLIKMMDASAIGKEESTYDVNTAVAGMRYFKSRLNAQSVSDTIIKIKEKLLKTKAVDYDDWVQENAAAGNSVIAKRSQEKFFQLSKKERRYSDVANTLDNTLQLFQSIEEPGVITPSSQNISYFAYDSFSDHLPIVIDVSYGQLPPVS